MSEEFIFDFGLEERLSGRRTLGDEFIREAWEHWVFVTNRPKSEPHERFVKAVRDAIADRYTGDRIIRAISGAAHLRPRDRDPLDVRRVVSAIRSENIERQVLELLDTKDAPIYPWSVGDPESNLSSLSDIRAVCTLDLDVWTYRDHECSGMIMQLLTPDRLKDAAEKVSLHTGTEHLSPSDIIRWSHIWRNPNNKVKVAAKASRDSYTSGKTESDLLEGIDIGLDNAAERAIISGCPANKVRSFHLLAPEGYWARVESEVEENLSASLDGIYDQLSGEFGWHPNDRGELKW